MTKRSRRPQNEAEPGALYEEPLWSTSEPLWSTSDEEIECLSESSTSEPSIAPTPSEALAEALTEQRALDEIWASITDPDWSPKCNHTEIINYHCLECGVNFC